MIKDECGRNTWKSAEFETRKYFEKVIHFFFSIQSGKHDLLELCHKYSVKTHNGHMAYRNNYVNLSSFFVNDVMRQKSGCQHC